MVFLVILCLSVTSLIPLCLTRSTEELRYECGPHGKFEYCIDGIPGCVIGCHCHPGYYFDTDSKICEPNTKLTHNLRQQYISEPSRVNPFHTPSIMESIPTPTTVNFLDEKGDDKDSDNLGDWLYNQFFKTIETSVINKTNDAPQLTRRSGDNEAYRPNDETSRGGEPNSSKDQRRTRKSWKGRGKKKRSKVHGLRRKLLRITEDDSLFESDSGSDSGGGGGSSGDSSSSSSKESGSSETSKEGKKDKPDDREHGHKKVIIFNRRPRPPLPSFVFLPNMDTPYYPQIGLPPPPVMPMYPMIPIPPMGPYLPFIDKKNDTTTRKPDTQTETETTTASTSTEAGSTVSEATNAPEVETEPPENTLRSRLKMHRPKRPHPFKSSEESFLMRSNDHEQSNPTSKQSERMKLIKKLREKLKMKSHTAPQDSEADEPEEDKTSLDEIQLLQNSLALHSSAKKHKKQKDLKLNDVPFKYISELIHRKNMSASKQTTPPGNVNANSKNIEPIQKTRRDYGEPPVLFNRKDEQPAVESDDAYFTNLGRQIAAVIRNIGPKVEQRPPEPNTKQDLINSLLNQNSFAPRSFWERSIRSPLTRLRSYFDSLNFYNTHSNEQNLYSLEDEVNSFASTTPPLSLQDLENILNTVQKAHAEISKSKKPSRHSNVSFNVNLLPTKPVRGENNYRKFMDKPGGTGRISETTTLPNITNVKYELPNTNKTQFLDHNDMDLPGVNVWMFNSPGFRPVVNLNQPVVTVSVKNKSLERDVSNYSLVPTVTPLPKYSEVIKNVPKKPHSDYLRFLKRMPLIIPLSAKKTIELPTKVAQPLATYPKVFEKYTDIDKSEKYESPTKYSDLPEKYAELPAKYPEQPEKHADPPPKYPELPEKYPELPEKYAEPPVKYPELPITYPELPINHPTVRAKYSMQPSSYPVNPALVNYQTLKYFTGTGNKHHYMFEAAYPLQIPTFKRSFSKRFEGGKPSYFHHELHHFDYFD